MIAVEVRDQHDVDRAGVDACSREVGAVMARLAVGLRDRSAAVPGVDHDGLAAGLHRDRAVRITENTTRHIGLLEERTELLLRNIGDEVIRILDQADAFENLDDFGVTQAMAEHSAGAAGRSLRQYRRQGSW